MSESKATIHVTYTDEAPALASFSLLPIVQAFCASSGIDIQTKDISLAGRILAQFPDRLSPEQRVSDALTELGELAKTPPANIIKLPNISASIPQLASAIAELQAHGYNIPDFPESPTNDEERAIRAAYGVVLGSAVNPVLREGNSDRRVAAPVKVFARNNPHSMGAWAKDSATHVSHMSDGDFFGSEQSHTMAEAGTVRIEMHAADGNVTVLKDNLALQAGEVIDASTLSASALRTFIAAQIDDAKAKGVLLSLHVKATMMKVSDPIIFGHVVREFFAPVFAKHGDALAAAGVNPDNGVGEMLGHIAAMDDATRQVIEADIDACYAVRPALAMVNSDKGITNLHVPSDVIIDASMPAAIRASGKMWSPEGNLEDMKAIIPDRSYAGVFQAAIDHCREHGAFDVTTMGNVSNVGLMAQKAEEYGSHDKTFQIDTTGAVKVVQSDDTVIFEHAVEPGDLWRMCQTKDAPIRDWVRLAVSRARATGVPTIFWLNEARAHDASLIKKVNEYLPEHDTSGLDIRIMATNDAAKFSLERIRDGGDTVSVTGNVLRDYLTDLFPILELGTSAKMLSIVPLLAGGGLFETGAGGSAPKHVQQFVEEGHLRWDSLGEFLAFGVSLEELAEKTGNVRLGVIANALDVANGQYLNNNKTPSRRGGELDNRGSHFYLALYWAQALAAQDDNADLATEFAGLAKALADNEQAIVTELAAAQGSAVELKGYFQPDHALVEAAMRPSKTFNDLLSPFIA
jgi:isocitrate dehydrogenase